MEAVSPYRRGQDGGRRAIESGGKVKILPLLGVEPGGGGVRTHTGHVLTWTPEKVAER